MCPDKTDVIIPDYYIHTSVFWQILYNNGNVKLNGKYKL